MNSTYRCQRCGNAIPIVNQMLHDLRCRGQNQQIQHSNYNQNFTNNYNYNDFNNNQINNNIISINTNSTSNPDGTITTTKTEIYQNGNRKITTIKYDQFGNVISQQSSINNPNNNFNNNMNFNNNSNNNVNTQRTVDQNGNVTETKIERFPNGQTRTTSVTRDRNGNIIMQNMSSNSGVNNFNNMQSFNMGMNSMMNGMNNMNYNMNGMNNMMNGMNNMNNMGNLMNNMNMMMNNMNQMFNNMFNNGMGNMNYLGNNMNQENIENGLEPTILNSLPTTKLKDVSKLEDDKKNCIICLEDFKVGDEVIYLPCLHVFHKDCILDWLKSHDDCPMCKIKINLENLN